MTDSALTIHLPDASTKEMAPGSTGLDLAKAIGSRLAKAALVVEVNGHLTDLSTALPDQAHVRVITADSEEGRHVLRHSTAHVLAQAVTQLFPGTTFSVGPATSDGFFYDFDLPGNATFSEEDLVVIEQRMREIVAQDQPFVREELSYDQALDIFAAQPYKREIVERVRAGSSDATDSSEVTGADSVSIYRNSPDFVDLCRGPHVPSTSRLGHFKLVRTSGSHWRGNEDGPALQRIYGTAWESEKALAGHFTRLEEAAKRDHRKLATELDLLSFPQELGGGLAVWHPKGALVRKLMEDYSRARHQDGGYQFVVTPHLANAKLYETSGHLGFYKDGMYPPMELDNGTYYPKPMNCPMHCLIFDARQRSYRELPLRLFELGTVYRYERAGTLHGLLRIRGFTQDDSHIYCTEEQLGQEVKSLLDFVMSVLRAFGFTDFTANLSTKDPDKYVGTDEIWDKATTALCDGLEAYGLDYQIKEANAAFYGPKIDIDVRDAIGRTWQLSTIQCDFNHPERFDLTYVAADGSHQRPIMLHRALFGSIERFFGVLLEHYEGAFPLWLAPVQVRVVPVSDAHEEYAARVVRDLGAAGFRSDIAPASDSLGRRVRQAKLEKVPYVVVVGDEDVSATTLGVNPRGGEVERGVSISDFITRLEKENEPN